MTTIPNVYVNSISNARPQGSNATINNQDIIDRARRIGVDSINIRINHDGDTSVQMRSYNASRTQIYRINTGENSTITVHGSARALNFSTPESLINSLHLFNNRIGHQTRNQISELLTVQESLFIENEQSQTAIADVDFNQEINNLIFEMTDFISNELDANESRDSAESVDTDNTLDRVNIGVISNDYILDQLSHILRDNVSTREVIDARTPLNLNASLFLESINFSSNGADLPVNVAPRTGTLTGIFRTQQRDATPNIEFPRFDDITHRVNVDTAEAIEPYRHPDVVCAISLEHVLTLEHPVELRGTVYGLSDLARAITNKHATSGVLEDPKCNVYHSMQHLLENLKAIDFNTELREFALEEHF